MRQPAPDGMSSASSVFGARAMLPTVSSVTGASFLAMKQGDFLRFRLIERPLLDGCHPLYRHFSLFKELSGRRPASCLALSSVPVLYYWRRM